MGCPVATEDRKILHFLPECLRYQCDVTLDQSVFQRRETGHDDRPLDDNGHYREHRQHGQQGCQNLPTYRHWSFPEMPIQRTFGFEPLVHFLQLSLRLEQPVTQSDLNNRHVTQAAFLRAPEGPSMKANGIAMGTGGGRNYLP